MNEGNNEDSRIARVSLACPPPYHFHLVDEELKGQSLRRFKWEIVASHLQSQKAHGMAQTLSRVCGVVIVLRRSYRVTKGDTEGQNGGWHRACRNNQGLLGLVPWVPLPEWLSHLCN